MHFVIKQTAWTEFQSVQTESVHIERKENAAQSEGSDSVTQRSQAHGTVTSDTLTAATETAASSTEHGHWQDPATQTKQASLPELLPSGLLHRLLVLASYFKQTVCYSGFNSWIKQWKF